MRSILLATLIVLALPGCRSVLEPVGLEPATLADAKKKPPPEQGVPALSDFRVTLEGNDLRIRARVGVGEQKVPLSQWDWTMEVLPLQVRSSLKGHVIVNYPDGEDRYPTVRVTPRRFDVTIPDLPTTETIVKLYTYFVHNDGGRTSVRQYRLYLPTPGSVSDEEPIVLR